ncbi:hypothetical protein TREES_T100014971 [Tupaia chinensis]|uniref:Uncharacterized protein n=1 Tax=Tupaia chinensis TaxID=246437 RepID=L9KP90_TUPCH|nr:hypothetical protein TREES_T100014971 [Tupaia chinensis]
METHVNQVRFAVSYTMDQSSGQYHAFTWLPRLCRTRVRDFVQIIIHSPGLPGTKIVYSGHYSGRGLWLSGSSQSSDFEALALSVMPCCH